MKAVPEALAVRLVEALRLCERALEERDAEAEAHAVKIARSVLADIGELPPP
jgi:hypothetical protein